mgnify:CR=1 FL=1
MVAVWGDEVSDNIEAKWRMNRKELLLTIAPILDWIDLALKQCEHLGMSLSERGAYLILRAELASPWK